MRFCRLFILFFEEQFHHNFGLVCLEKMTNTTNETTFLVDEQTGGGGGGGGGGLEQQTKIGEEEATKKDHHQNDLQMGKGTTFKSSANDAKDRND